jgi:hypothetical protein
MHRVAIPSDAQFDELLNGVKVTVVDLAAKQVELPRAQL